MIIEYFHCNMTAIVLFFVQLTQVLLCTYFQWYGEDIPIWNRVETVSDFVFGENEVAQMV